jgi:GGDEF domain-containing protein
MRRASFLGGRIARRLLGAGVFGARRKSAPPQQALKFDLFSARALVVTADRMLQRARSERQPFSVAVVDVSDLPELHSLFGSAVAERIVAEVMRRLRTVAGSKGLAVRTGPTEFTAVLPGRERETALTMLGAAFGAACFIEYDTGGDEIVLLPDFAAEDVSDECGSIRDRYELLRQRVARMQRPAPARHARQPQRGSAPMTGEPAAAMLYVPTVPLPLPAR